MFSSPESPFCMEMLRRVVGNTKEPKVLCDSKKDKLFDAFLKDAEEDEEKQQKRGKKVVVLSHPTLLQVVYSSGARKHFLASRWVDALHFEMRELMRLVSESCNDDHWMDAACREVLYLEPKKCFSGNGKKSLQKIGWQKKKAAAAAMQVIEFPNFMQRTHKFYVDWDKKLSEVEDQTYFFPGKSSSSSGGDFLQRRAKVEKIRQLALGTPCAIMRLLSLCGSPFSSSVEVFVKEGTRKQNKKRNDKEKSDDGEEGESDWKISFHFVFQILVSSTQFRLIYHRLSQLICKEASSLAVALNLADCENDEDGKRVMMTDAMLDPAFGALVGVDMHPKQNVFQVRVVHFSLIL